MEMFLAGWPGAALGTGRGPGLKDPAHNHRRLPAVVSNHYLPHHGIPSLGAWHRSKKSCPKGCREVVKLSRTAGPTSCPPACPYLTSQPSPRLAGRTPRGPWHTRLAEVISCLQSACTSLSCSSFHIYSPPLNATCGFFPPRMLTFKGIWRNPSAL